MVLLVEDGDGDGGHQTEAGELVLLLLRVLDGRNQNQFLDKRRFLGSNFPTVLSY